MEEDIIEHAIESFPDECVGYITAKGYHRLKNISKSSQSNYKLSIDDKIMLSGMKSELISLVHSHTVMDSTPSGVDLLAQKSTGFHFTIIGTDGVTTTKLEEIPYESTNT